MVRTTPGSGRHIGSAPPPTGGQRRSSDCLQTRRPAILPARRDQKRAVARVAAGEEGHGDALSLASTPTTAYDRTKRLIDVVVTLILLMPAMVVIAVCALAIRAHDGGP